MRFVTSSFSPPLPVDHILPALLADLAHTPNAVLCAPPGAGKTTRVPLALLDAPWLENRNIIMLEPRRLAAKCAARFMARLLGETVGQRVGYRMRLESRISAHTRIEVVTEGVLTRMLQEDPALERVACVIFDEFHERSLNADTGLALCLEAQTVLRPDLRLLVMSATLDSAAVSPLLGGCPEHHSEGRAFPVDIRYAPPRRSGISGRPPRMEEHVAAVVRHALSAETGSILVFLPGTAEIRRVEEYLTPPPPGVDIYPLYGGLPPHAQDAALAPAPSERRKVVLSTAIAETSLTIEGIRVVVDAGLARTAVFNPATGMGRLVTGRVSLAGATQRAGRAGRTEPGIAWRLWDAPENASLRPFAKPEILEADLAPLLLQLAAWGVNDPKQLSWLDSPPHAAVVQAREVLLNLEALDVQGRITAHGKKLSALPLHPRVAHMLLRIRQHAQAPLACCLAALIGERLPGGQGTDLRPRLIRLCRDGSGEERARRAARQIARMVSLGEGMTDTAFFRAAMDACDAAGSFLALAWPEWLAQRGEPGQFRMRNGRLAVLPLEDTLAREPFLAVAALDGGAAHARIHSAAPLTEADVLALFGTQVIITDQVFWDAREEAVLTRRKTSLGALVLRDAPLSTPDADACTEALLEGIALLGLHVLPWTEETRQWQGRVNCMRELEGDRWPDVTDAALLRTLPQWLGPFTKGITRRAHLRRLDLAAALSANLTWELSHRLERQAPTHMEVPSGSRPRIDYTKEGGPVLAVKLQEMFGCTDTPCIADGRLPLILHLNSPAGRPLQMTRDLRSFWVNGYPAIRGEMRGRYPRHPWPDDPTTATPTRRAKQKN